MVLVTGSWKLALAGMAVSLAIFGVLYFTVIQPDNNAANIAVRSGVRQAQNALNQAQTQLSQASSQAGAAGSQASKSLSQASKLTACVAAAGTDVSKVQSCEAKYGQ